MARGHDAAPRPRLRRRALLGRPVAGFGDPAARLVVGLTRAHGGNRTGRVFTGDRSGDWLSGRSAGRIRQPARSVSRDDGLTLDGAWVSAAVRCAPPANKPTPAERDNLLGYLAVSSICCLGSGPRVLGQFACRR